LLKFIFIFLLNTVLINIYEAILAAVAAAY
jgi:hypothetical protein